MGGWCEDFVYKKVAIPSHRSSQSSEGTQAFKSSQSIPLEFTWEIYVRTLCIKSSHIKGTDWLLFTHKILTQMHHVNPKGVELSLFTCKILTKISHVNPKGKDWLLLADWLLSPPPQTCLAANQTINSARPKTVPGMCVRPLDIIL